MLIAIQVYLDAKYKEHVLKKLKSLYNLDYIQLITLSISIK